MNVPRFKNFNPKFPPSHLGWMNNVLVNQFQADNQACMDLMQRAIDLLIQNQTKANGGLNSKGRNSSTPVSSPSPISINSGVKEISLGFPHFDGQTPVME